MDNPYTHRLVRAAINEKLEGLSTISVEFQAMEVKVFPLEAVLYGLRVTTRTEPRKDLLEAAHVAARVSLWSLFMGRPALGLLEFNELKMSYPLPDEFMAILAKPEEEKEREPVVWPPEFDLPIERVVFINSTFQLAVPAAKPGEPDVMNINLGGVNLDFEYNNWNSIDAALEIRSTNLFIWQRHLVQDALLTMEIKLRKELITTPHFELTSHNLNFTSKTQVRLATESRQSPLLGARKFFYKVLTAVNLQCQIAVRESDLSVLGAFLAIDKTGGHTEGETEVKVNIPLDGSAVDWSVDGVGRVKGAELYGFQLYDSETGFEVSEDAITFHDIKLKRGEEVFGKGSGSIGFSDDVPFTFMAAPQGMPLVTILNAVKVPDFKVLDAGVTSEKITVAGQGVPFKLLVAGEGELTGVTVPLIKYDQSRFPDKPDCHLSISLLANAKGLHFDGSKGTCQIPGVTEPAPITLAGATWFDETQGMDLTIKTAAADARLGQHYAQFSLAGKVNATTRIKGPYNNLIIHNSVQADGMVAAGIPLGKVRGDADVSVKKDLVIFNNLTAAPEDGQTIAITGGTLSTVEPYNIDVKLTGDKVGQPFFAAVFNLIDTNLGVSFGVNRVQGQLKGPLVYPLAYEMLLDFDVKDINYDEQLLATRLHGKIASSPAGWQIEKVNYQLGTYEAVVSVDHQRRKPFKISDAKSGSHVLSKLGADPKDYIKIKIRTLAKEDGLLRPANGEDVGSDELHLLPYAGKVLAEAGISGQILLNADLEGHFGRLQGQFNGGITNPFILGSPVAPLHFQGFLTGSRVELSEITHAGNSLVGRLDFDFLEPGVPYRWYFNFNRFDLRALGTSFFYQDPRNFAYLTANWTMQGKFQNWWHSRGNMNISNIEINFVNDVDGQTQKLELTHEFPVQLVFDEKGWNIEGGKELYLKGEHGSFFVSTNDNRPPKRLNVAIKGNLEMVVFKKLFSFIDTARGRLVLDGSITGSVAEPKTSFKIKDKTIDPFNANEWEAVSLGFVDIPPAFNNIRIDVEIKNGKIEINRLTALKGKSGRISVTGKFNPFPEDPEPSSILISLHQIDFNRLPVAVFKSVDATVNGDLVLTGNQLPVKLAGNIVIDRAQSLGNFDIRNQIIDVIRRRKFNSPSAPEEPVIKFDIHVQANESVQIKNRNLVATLGGELRILGNDQTPLILGQVSVPRGKFNYKRDFSIRRGLIIFDEPVSPPDPRLDIIGESQVSRYKVQVMISGYASDPKVSLSVEPPNRPDGTPITKVDILLLLTSGRLPDTERSIGASQSAARSEALNLVIGQFEEPIEKLFDLSGQTVVRQVYLDTYTSEVDGDPIARLNLPISVSEDVNFIFQVDNDSNMKVSSEYSLHDSISVSGSFDKKNESELQKTPNNLPADTDTGVDLRFRFSFP